MAMITEGTFQVLTGSAGLETSEVVLEPGNVYDVEMVSRLIEQEDIGLEKHGSGKRKLHLPTTRKRANGGLLALVIEANGTKGIDDLSLGGLYALISDDELQDSGILLAAIDIVFDVESADFLGRREALDLAVGDGAHESGLKFVVIDR
jgi:hypothetical protein